MDNLSNQSTKDLAIRLNQIIVTQENLSLEYNQIIKELWHRYPHLTEDEDLQPQELQDDPLWGKLLVNRKDNSTCQRRQSIK